MLIMRCLGCHDILAAQLLRSTSYPLPNSVYMNDITFGHMPETSCQRTRSVSANAFPTLMSCHPAAMLTVPDDNHLYAL